MTCGVHNEHSTRSCPISKTCFTCGLKGHINKACIYVRATIHASCSTFFRIVRIDIQDTEFLTWKGITTAIVVDQTCIRRRQGSCVVLTSHMLNDTLGMSNFMENIRVCDRHATRCHYTSQEVEGWSKRWGRRGRIHRR